MVLRWKTHLDHKKGQNNQSRRSHLLHACVGGKVMLNVKENHKHTGEIVWDQTLLSLPTFLLFKIRYTYLNSCSLVVGLHEIILSVF